MYQILFASCFLSFFEKHTYAEIWEFNRKNDMKKALFILLISIFVLLTVYAKPDLNKSSLEELKTLPISEEQAEDIYNYRFYTSFFKSVFELRNIESIDQKTLNLLKPLVTVSHYDDKDETATRRDEIYYLLQRLGSSEGSQEGISDIWEDYLITPRNINAIGYSDILSMPNVSPIDAASILNRRALGDSISSYRDLRKTFGMSHYGATNLKNYVYYTESKANNKLFVDYQVKYNDTYYEENTEEMYKEGMIHLQQTGSYLEDAPKIKMQSPWGYFKMDEYSASITNKLRLRYNNNWKAGIIKNTQRGEANIFENEIGDSIKNSKAFAGFEDFIYGSNYLKVYAGNYRATFGEGLVMENTDFYSARKTGHGFSKRITGIVGDLSRTQEYALNGGAVEWKSPHFNAAVFYSNDDKDALVADSNKDGIIDEEDDLFSYITMSRRFENEQMEEMEDFYNSYELPGYDNLFSIQMAPRLDAFNEQVLGGHFEYSPFVGSHIGFTGYEATYDRDFVIPDSDELKYLMINVKEEDLGSEYDTALEKYRIADSEIAALYSTKTDDYDRNYRTILGLDFRTVLDNTSFSGEYAELIENGYEDLNFGKNPKALLLSTYSQFEDAYFIALFRDYDLGFDNPYGRGFSEHEKFNGTVLDKYAYVLTNPLMSDMYLNSAQAQAERGIYFETRYKILRNLTLNRTYIDIWERKSDSRFSIRFQGELDFRPIYQLSLRLKYKHQTNRYDDDADRSVSITNETTGKVSMNLSAFDRISFEYRLNKVWFPPYTYLTNDPESHTPGAYEDDTIAQATALLHGDYLAVDYIHNFNTNLKVQGAFIFWNGHGASQWDWEDMEIDFMGEKGMKFWFAIHDKIANNLYLTLKYKIKRYETKEIEYRSWGNETPYDISDGDEPYVYIYERVEKTQNAIRLQLDYKF